MLEQGQLQTLSDVGLCLVDLDLSKNLFRLRMQIANLQSNAAAVPFGCQNCCMCKEETLIQSQHMHIYYKV